MNRKPRGRHPERRLTAVAVRNAKGPARLADGNGLYLQIDESGARRWMLRTVVQGRRRDIGLGSLQTVSLQEARDEAARLRRLARRGEDPLVERRRERRVVPTFSEGAKAVHASIAGTFRNPKHREQWLASLTVYAFPFFGNRPIDQVGTDDVLKALNTIWATKPETARRVRQRLKMVFEWARAAGHRSGDNPVDGVARVLPRVKASGKHHASLPYADVPAFMQVLRTTPLAVASRLALQFAMLNATRTGEARLAVWSEIDRENRTWTIPGKRMKAGLEHRVPLSVESMALLDEAAAIADGGQFIFPGNRPQQPLSSMALLMLLRRLKRTDITVHGFRASFRIWSAEKSSAPREVCEAALAHVIKDRAERAYQRSDLFEQRRRLMEDWAKFAMTAPAKILKFESTGA